MKITSHREATREPVYTSGAPRDRSRQGRSRRYNTASCRGHSARLLAGGPGEWRHLRRNIQIDDAVIALLRNRQKVAEPEQTRRNVGIGRTGKGQIDEQSGLGQSMEELFDRVETGWLEEAAADVEPVDIHLMGGQCEVGIGASQALGEEGSHGLLKADPPFREMGIMSPDHRLGLGGAHGSQSSEN